MADMKRPHHPLVPCLLVFSTVIFQLAAAWILDTAAGMKTGTTWTIVGIAVVAALGLNIGRFIIWGYTHRHFPLSQTYPLTALFFPCILLLSYIQGEPTNTAEIAGTALITVGAIVMGARKQHAGD